MDILVLAKEPLPGRVKTRLCPPCTPDDAALLAQSALVDTFAAALAAGADRVIAVLEGRPGPWLPANVEVQDQGGGSFNDRLARAWAGQRAPTVQIGMDTPQVDGAMLRRACELTIDSGAAFGLAADGGWWALGLRRPRSDLFHSVPPSTATTGRMQLAVLRRAGIVPAPLDDVRDVDTWADATAVADAAPNTRFAAAVCSVEARLHAAER